MRIFGDDSPVENDSAGRRSQYCAGSKGYFVSLDVKRLQQRLRECGVKLFYDELSCLT